MPGRCHPTPHVLEAPAQRLRSVHRQGPDRQHRPGSGLHRAGSCDPELADQLDLAVNGLGHRVGLPRKDGTRREFGVDGVALAEPSPAAAVRAVEVDETKTRRARGAAEAGAVGAAALDADGEDLAHRARHAAGR